MKRMTLTIISMLALLYGGAASASTALENANLALVVRQLQAVYPLIYKAQQQANPNAREQFHYAWLRGDLGKIIAGINQKLKPQPIEPRKITPIKGDYITIRSKSL